MEGNSMPRDILNEGTQSLTYGQILKQAEMAEAAHNWECRSQSAIKSRILSKLWKEGLAAPCQPNKINGQRIPDPSTEAQTPMADVSATLLTSQQEKEIRLPRSI